MKELTIGKIRGLQQISTTAGHLAICAIDHRTSLLSMIGQGHPENVSYQTMVEYKMELCQALSPVCSAILLDPVYGAQEAIAQDILPGHTGLLVSLEASGYETKDEGRLTQLLEGWTVGKVKRMGGSAVKLLLYYRPDLMEIATPQLETVRKVAIDCQENDIPFLVETVCYAFKSEKADSLQFAAKRLELIVKTARQISEMPTDVFKVEFPSSWRHEKDEGKLIESCRRVDGASPNPWVLLSAGVDFETYAKEVEMACRGGASGFAAGRAIWQEGITISDKRERKKYLSTVAADRLKRLNEIVAKYAVPWQKKLKLKPQQLTKLSEDWYRSY